MTERLDEHKMKYAVDTDKEGRISAAGLLPVPV